MKRYILIVFVFSVLVLFLVSVYLIQKNTHNRPVDIPIDNPIIPPNPIVPIPQVPATSTTTATPAVPAVDVPTVDELFSILNATMPVVGDEGHLIAVYTSDYSVSYSKRFNELRILVASEPAAKYRTVAEDVLIDASLEKETLCALNVDVSRRTEYTNNDFQTIGLSFCPGSVSDEALLLEYQFTGRY